MKCSDADVHVEKCPETGLYVSICRHDVVSQGTTEDRARQAILEACGMVEDDCLERGIPNPLVFATGDLPRIINTDDGPRFDRGRD